jgi:hypothetical protein
MIKSLQSPWNILPFPLSAPPEDLYLFLERERKHTINPTPPQSGGREPPLLLGGRPAPPWRARPSEGPAVPVSQTLTLAGAADPAEGPPSSPLVGAGAADPAEGAGRSAASRGSQPRYGAGGTTACRGCLPHGLPAVLPLDRATNSAEGPAVLPLVGPPAP